MAAGTGLSTEGIFLLEDLMHLDGIVDETRYSGGNLQTVGDLLATLDVK